jgi:hypothetical protein
MHTRNVITPPIYHSTNLLLYEETLSAVTSQRRREKLPQSPAKVPQLLTLLVTSIGRRTSGVNMIDMIESIRMNPYG